MYKQLRKLLSCLLFPYMKIIKTILLSTFLFVLFSCHSKKDEEGENIQVTKRIRYEVGIKTPDPSYDWWVQNIEGEKRERFLGKIIKAAYDGELQVYSSFGKTLTTEEVKNIQNDVDSFYVQSETPPYKDSLVVIKNRLKINEITKISFLEKWELDEENYNIIKKTLGYAPLIEIYDHEGNFKGYQPLFWIYIDENYPGKLTNPTVE